MRFRLYRFALPLVLFGGSVLVAAGEDRNPVVVIHGFGGSALVRTEDGASVFGEWFTKGSVLPSTPEGLRALALDVDGLPADPDPGDLAWIDDDVEQAGLLEAVRGNVLVKEISVGVYQGLIEAVEAAGYAECRDDPEASPGEAPECLIYAYDWRQDNVAGAIGLGRFLEKAAEALAAEDDRDPENVKFDLVAHSNGGLVARYYLRYGARDVLEDPPDRVPWDGARHINRVVLIATPNFGTMKAAKNLVRGQQYPVLSYEPTLEATWVALYQLLPRERHSVWLDRSGQPIDVGFTSASTWRRNRWGPFAPKQGKHLEVLFPKAGSHDERLQRMTAFMDAAFERGRRFHAALDLPPETAPPVPMFLVLSDSEPTFAKAIVAGKPGNLELKFKSKKKWGLAEPGDGMVTVSSALADVNGDAGASAAASPVVWDRIIYVRGKHRPLMGNDGFGEVFRELLAEAAAEH